MPTNYIRITTISPLNTSQVTLESLNYQECASVPSLLEERWIPYYRTHSQYQGEGSAQRPCMHEQRGSHFLQPTRPAEWRRESYICWRHMSCSSWKTEEVNIYFILGDARGFQSNGIDAGVFRSLVLILLLYCLKKYFSLHLLE